MSIVCCRAAAVSLMLGLSMSLALATGLRDKELPAAYPRPVSDWKEAEKAAFQKLLLRGKFDVLVVPFQVQELALDRATRSLMTAQLALAIASDKLKVPDPYLVARALGEGDRKINNPEIYALADKLGVSKIVWSHVGHDRNYRMSLTVQTQQRGVSGFAATGGTLIEKKFEGIVFSDERPPLDAYEAMLPNVLASIGMPGPNPPKAGRASHPVDLPSSVGALELARSEPVRDALYFQLLAYLAPSDSRARERLAEKSYLAVRGLPPASPDYRTLKARAWMLLGMRPAALEVLGRPGTAEEKALFAMLNGNQPEVVQHASQVSGGIKSFLAKKDALDLGSYYAGADAKEALAALAALKLPGEAWSLLAARAFSAADTWTQFDNLDFKQLLDADFPIRGYSAEQMLRGAAALGDAQKMQMLGDMAVLNHVRKVLEIDAAKWCCKMAVDRPTGFDYLSLVEAVGEDNLMRQAGFYTNTQGVPERALEFLGRIEQVYKGHAGLSLAQAHAQVKGAAALEGAAKAGMLKSAYANLFNAIYWEQGQSRVSSGARRLIPNTSRSDYGHSNNIYAADFPFKSYYDTWEDGGNAQRMIANAEAALKNSTSNLAPLSELHWRYTEWLPQKEKNEALLKSVEGRFRGNAQLPLLLAKNSIRTGDLPSAERHLGATISLQPKVWSPYVLLGGIYFRQGQLEKAAELFGKHPDFKADSNANAVGVSNQAYEAGSMFYWVGEFALATPFYAQATRRPTGSSADMTSSLRLKLLAGDLQGALNGSLQRASRYNEPYAYRDYLAMLHAMGRSSNAWDAFNSLAPGMNNANIWQSALVGHRREGKSEADIADWVRQKQAIGIGKKANHAVRYLVQAGLMDRMPGKELANSVAELALPVWKLEYANGMVVEPTEDGRFERILGPVTKGGSVLPIGVFERVKKARVKSSLAYFAEAYRSIRTGDFSAARESLREASTLYDFSHPETAHLLPYYAYAAARAGDAAAVETYLNGLGADKQGFDYLLAKAAVSGIAGKTDESVGFLKSALYLRPFTEERPIFSEYQYAEFAEWMYEATGKAAYRDIALDWARKNQRFQPWFAWAYALEAKLSDNVSDRQRAIAMTLYLDPQSDRIGKVTAADKEAARKAFAGSNPFVRKPNPQAATPT